MTDDSQKSSPSPRSSSPDIDIPCAQEQTNTIEFPSSTSTFDLSSSRRFPFNSTERKEHQSGKCNSTGCLSCKSFPSIMKDIHKRRTSTIIYICPQCQCKPAVSYNPYNYVVKLPCRKHALVPKLMK